METITLVPAGSRRQIRLLAGTLALIFVLLALGYHFFIRTDYAVLYSDLRPADASAIVEELEAKGVSYKLEDQGATILVAKGESDSVRLAIVRSDAPLKGSSGFELFNKSDMGLTDFAQKINYQRALQGELARTIMMMEGVEDARVHLTIPERSLFRGARSEPKAGVTLNLQRGKFIDEARVAGIQRLVASAVPDLKLGDVVILDELGRIISQGTDGGIDTALPPEMAERNAVQEYYRAHIRKTVEAILPGVRADARVLVVPEPATADSQWTPDGSMTPNAPLKSSAGNPSVRNFRIRVSVITPALLEVEEQERVRSALARAVGLSPESGDSLLFARDLAPTVRAGAAVPPVSTAATPHVRAAPAARNDWAPWLLAMAVMGALLALVYARARTSGISAEQRDVLVLRIRRQLSLAEGRDDA